MGMDYSLQQRIIDGTGMILDTEPGTPDDVGTYVTENQLADWIKGKILFTGYYHNGNFYSDSGHTTLLAKVNGALYIDQTNANKALYVCLSSTYQSLTEEAQVQAIRTELANGTLVPLKATQDSLGNQIDTTYAKKADLLDGTIVVKEAEIATKDEDGNNIKATYETKADASDLKDALSAHEARIENLEEAHGSYHEVDVKSVYTIPSGKGKNWLIDGLRGVSRVENNLIPTNRNTGSYTASSDTASYDETAHYLSSTEIQCVSGHTYLMVANVTRNISTNNQLSLIMWPKNMTGNAAVVFANGESNGQKCSLYTANGNGYFERISFNDYNGKRGFNAGDSVSYSDLCFVDLNVHFNTTDLSFLGNTDSAKLATIQTSYPWLLTPSDYGTSGVNTVYEGIKSIGVNLIDASNLIADSYVDSLTGIIKVYSGVKRTDYMRVKGGESYFFGGYIMANKGNTGAYFDINKNFLGAIPNDSDARPFVAPANCAYVVMNFWLTNWGDLATTAYFVPYDLPHVWSPYMESTLTFPSPVSLKSAGAVAETKSLCEEVEIDGVKVLKSVERHPIGQEDMATMAWSYNSTYDCYTCTLSDYSGTDGAYICANYANGGARAIENMASAQKGIYNWGKRLQVKDSASPTGILYFALATPNPDTYADPILDNLIPTEAGGTIESILTNPVDDSMTLGYINL